jgi:hypothetical protein
MGLDWMLDKVKARPGSEARFDEITKMLEDMKEDARSPELEAEHEAISMSVFEAVGAPRTGEDPRADEWFREHVYEPAHEDALAGKRDAHFQDFWKRSFEECLEGNKGKYVIELAEKTGGVAAVSGIATSNLDFRGKMLRFCEGLPEDLVDESYEDHTAEECVDYARRLEEQLPHVSEEHRRTVQDAASWLRFWGELGFGYHAWY